MIASGFHLERWRLDRSISMERDAVEEARYHQPGRRMRYPGKVRLSVARMIILLDAGIGQTNISLGEMTLGSADSRSLRRKQSIAHY